MHSQVAGLVWISVVLLFLAGIAVFIPKQGGRLPQKDSTYTADSMILTSREDSVYSSRRSERHKAYSSRHYSAANNVSKTENGVASTKETAESSDTPHPRLYKRQTLTVELNSADTTTLQMLYGIGPVYARRIVRYRDRLGGFTSKEQLMEVYGFTPELLERISPYITLDTSSIVKMNINSITLKQLIKHPYVEYYQARDIVSLRNRGVRFHSADDLRAMPSMTESTLLRLLPYIDFD